jgi:3-hydroxyacyl-CoA dehydrogenase
LRFTADLKEAVAGADLVQENAPEREPVKIKLFAELDSILPPPAISGVEYFRYSYEPHPIRV